MADLNGTTEIILKDEAPPSGQNPEAGSIYKWIEDVAGEKIYKYRDENGNEGNIGTTGGAITEAPVDGNQYSRSNGSWEKSSELYDDSGDVAVDVGSSLVGDVNFSKYGDSRTEADTIKYLQGLTSSGKVVQQISNSGQVKINSYNGSTKPEIVGVVADDAEFFAYSGTLDLSSSPTTSWPKNISSPSDSDIIDPVSFNFLENPIAGQVHIWRIEYTYSGKGGNNNLGLTFGFRNPSSGFIVTNSSTLPSGTSSSPDVDFGGGDSAVVPSSFVLITIADSNSIGTGYELFCSSTVDDNNFTVTIENVTRVSTEYILRTV